MGSTVTAPDCVFRETIWITKPLTVTTAKGVVDGEGLRLYAFRIVADDVTITGFEITGTTNPAQFGAITVRQSNRFTLSNAYIHHTGGACVSIVGGAGHQIVESELAYCDQEGFHLSLVSNMVLARNNIHHNNPNWSYSPGWEAGAGKASRSTHLTFEGNEVHHNNGFGLWCDGGCREIIFRGNRTYHNTHAGLFIEISEGPTLFEYNVAWENGFALPGWGYGSGILAQSSSNVEIRNNVVAWNADGINVMSQERAHDGIIQHVRNVYVHDNDIILSPQSSDASIKIMLGWLQDWSGGVTFDAASNNRGQDNRYWHSQTDGATWGRFEWVKPIRYLNDFNATPGEQQGRYMSTSERDALLAAVGIPPGPAQR